jgi:CMP-N-acetylneuraminic acid synthetase
MPPLAVLGLIPARGGSKGIRNKNLAPLCGRPLLAYTADAVRESTRLTRTVVSTNDLAIAEAARALGLDVPFARPEALSADDTLMLPVVQHALRTAREGGFQPDAVALLQPTSPLRRGEHIDAAIALLETSQADSVVSVVEVPHQFNPVSVMRLDGERLRPFVDEGVSASPASLKNMITRRQDKPRVLARNGPAVLVTRAATIDAGSLYGDDCRPLLMAAEDSLDVDSHWDLAMAEFILLRRRAVRA